MSAIILSENTRFGGETGAGLMRNRCAFTARDMAADWAESFTYAIVLGWHSEDDPEDGYDALGDQAAKWGWDDALVTFLIDAHQRFKQLADRHQDGAA